MKKTELNNPPKIARWLLCKLRNKIEHEPLIGDYDEIYQTYNQEYGQVKSRIWYCIQILKTIPVFIKTTIYWSLTMFRNYLKIALRNIKRQKGYSIINIAGLSISMACSFLILLYILNELSFDRYHKNANEIYRVIKDTHSPANRWWTATPEILVSEIKKDIPEIKNVTRFRMREEVVKYNDKQFIETNFYFGDPAMLEIFSFPLLSGNPETVLNEPFTILITEEIAGKYFGNINPVGKVITVSNYDYTITGVLKNIPYNSQFRFDFLASFKSLDQILTWPNWRKSWGANFLRTYILTWKNVDSDLIEKKLQKYNYTRPGGETSFHMEPFTKIHFYGKCDIGELPTKSDIRYIYIFTAVAIFILMIAVSNYMNLTTAKYTLRVREIGIRKIVGAHKKQLIRQFLNESIIFSFIAMFLSLILVYLALPYFNSLLNKNISFSFLKQGKYLIFIFGITLFTGLISGSYPAFFLSAFRPVKMIKGNLNIGTRSSRFFRNSLVTTQFIISIILITGTIIAVSQLRFMKNKDLGYNKEFAIRIFIRGSKVRSNLNAIKNELLKYQNISSVSISTNTPDVATWIDNPVWEGKEDSGQSEFHRISADASFFNLYDLEIIEGQKPSENFKNIGYLLNETAVNMIGWKEPIGKRFGFWRLNGTVLGVFKDFHFKHMNTKIGPMAIGINDSGHPRFISIKIGPNDISATLDYTKKTWARFAPDFPLEYSFVDNEIDKLYRADRSLLSVFKYFTFIAIFVTCLGLSGLISFIAERRTKEIGIRKVLGASVSNVIGLMSREFLPLILIALFCAWPVSYYVMDKWLQNYAYRINISLFSLIFSGLLIFIVAFLTVSLQTIKAARKNPVDSLRYE